jgi:adenosylcobinamide-GDP ribazoletransferase
MTKKFITAVQFLTIIPINRNIQILPEELAKSTFFFPLVGIIIGSFLVITNEVFSPIFSNLLVACVILIVEIVITCGFHLDGLIDTFDGLFSGFKNRDRIIEIMKDSRVGGMGVIFLFVFLLLKFSLIYELSPLFKNKILLLMPGFGRWTTVLGVRFFPSAITNSNSSLGRIYKKSIENKEFFISTLFLLLAGVLILKSKFILFFLIITLLIIIFFLYIKIKIGGITGDILGAGCEIGEVLFLIIGVLL